MDSDLQAGSMADLALKVSSQSQGPESWPACHGPLDSKLTRDGWWAGEAGSFLLTLPWDP